MQIVGCFAAGLLLQIAVLVTWARHYVSEDQALLWAAARSWGRGNPAQPNFWGQTYGTTIEAVPAEVLRQLGVTLEIGLPVGILMINSIGWVVLGVAAWRQSRRSLALIAFGLPALLPPQYLVLTVAYNTAAARTLAMIAAAFVVGFGEARWVPYVGLSVAGLATLLDNSVILIAVPTLVLAASAIARSWPGPLGNVRGSLRTLSFTALAVVPAVAWHLFTSWWYDAHPEDDLHPAPVFEPSLDRLGRTLSHVGRYLGTYSVVYSPVSIVPFLAIAVVVVLAVRRSSWTTGISAMAVLVLALMIMSVPRAEDWMPTAYYPASRVLLTLPVAIWLICVMVPRRTPVAGPSSGIGRVQHRMPLLITGLCLALCGVRLVRWHTDVVPLRNDAVDYPNYPLVDVASLKRDCESVRSAASESGVEFVVFAFRTPAYACAGVFGDEITTIYPAYERRSWLLRRFLQADERDFLLAQHEPTGCDNEILSCRQVAPDLTIVHVLTGHSIRDAVLGLGFAIRPPF